MASAASNDLAASTIAPVDPAPAPSDAEPAPVHLPSTSPVEMSNLNSQTIEQNTGAPDTTPHNSESQPSNEQAAHPNAESSSSTAEIQRPEPAHLSPPRPTRLRQDSEAIGPPAEDNATASTLLQQSANPEAGPAVLVTLILLNGARHPYKIDQKYLRKRNICGENDTINPFDISVYTMKELIWRDWREEWVPRPNIPGAIRLIYFGKLLDDKQTLADCRFQEDMANAVHMTVRPQEFIDDEDNAKGSKFGASRLGRADDGDGDTGCRCCLVM